MFTFGLAATVRKLVSMNIQIRQIKGDIIELVFNPKEEDLRVGENLSMREKGSNRGLIIQVIELRTVTYPSLLLEMLQLVAEDPLATTADLSQLTEERLPEMSNLCPFQLGARRFCPGDH